MTNKKQSTTNNIKIPSKNLEILKQNFSHCFNKEGNFDFEKFKQELVLNEDIDFSNESYGMDWLGKSYARLLACDDAKTLLKEDEDWNKKPQNKNSENLLIKGDNLEVLKHLSNAYFEKIKMIYIDPPYNTGGDGFVYEDDRKFSIEELSKLAGIDKEKAKRILDFTQSKSNSHSAWLTFMYPRLYIAKQLLKDDGVIFVSIDDNEVAQLRLLMDEIFGEENFLGQIIWQTATDNNKSQISTEHEYILVYCKVISNIDKWEISTEKGEIIQQKYLELKQNFKEDIEKIQTELKKWITTNKKNKKIDLSGVEHYSYVDQKGVYYPGNSSNTKPGGYLFDIIHPITKKICGKPKFGYRWPETTFWNANDDGNVEWGKDETTIPKIKKRIETATELFKSVYYEDNRKATKELTALMDNNKIFENPKSVALLQRIMRFTIGKEDIILDFFAGSGTTGDAVMQLNAEDGGNRKYILVQLPETIDPKKNKTAYDFVKNELKIETPTIFDVTKERLVRASKKIQEDNEKSKEPKDLSNIAFGFKVFETIPNNEGNWEKYILEAENFDSQTKLFDESKLSKEDLKTLLTTWKTYDGFALTKNLTQIDLDGYIGYYLENKLYLINKGFETKHLKKLLEEIDENKEFNPAVIIVFGYNFQSKILREIADNVKNYANKKHIDIDFVTRY